jgi:hypothetical protein
MGILKNVLSIYVPIECEQQYSFHVLLALILLRSRVYPIFITSFAVLCYEQL